MDEYVKFWLLIPIGHTNFSCHLIRKKMLKKVINFLNSWGQPQKGAQLQMRDLHCLSLKLVKKVVYKSLNSARNIHRTGALIFCPVVRVCHMLPTNRSVLPSPAMLNTGKGLRESN